MTPTLKIQFLSFCIFLGLFSTETQFSFAQNAGAAQNPLNFGNNFFVTGDYIVAGTVGMNKSFQTINGTSYTVGTITVPDRNPGIQGATQVPKGAQVVAALLYWQTVEMTGAAAGGPGSGQNGFFRPLLYKSSGGPAAPGYPISGVNVGSTTAITWSGGTCAGTSSSKITRTYRADVGGGLPIDANGNQLANGSFEVRLPSVGTPATPLTFGATLVIIYRIPTGALPEGAARPSVPLNAIVFFDGAADPGATTGSVTQLLNGFYDADLSPISRLTYIGGNGSPGRTETLSLSSTGPLGANAPVRLPSLYPKLPTFPGYYSSSYGWDNPTWTFSSPNNPIQNDALSATTQLMPSGMSAGCISTAAVIFSTTVDNPEHDGILHSWKTNQGYCDATINIACSGSGDPAWVALPGAVAGEQDVFLQYDYVCSNVTGPGSCHTSTVIDQLSAAAPSGGMTKYSGTFAPTIPVNTTVGIDGFANPGNNGNFMVVDSGDGTYVTVNNPSGVTETNPGVAIYGAPGDQSYSFDPRLAVDYEDVTGGPHATAVDKVVAAYANHSIHLHVFPGNAIAESQPALSCISSDLTCIFPNEPGTVGFREGLDYIKNTNIEPTTGVLGCGVPSNTCLPVFQHGKKDSYHYALFSHGVGLPSWFLSDGSLQSVVQTGNTVTFTTKLPHGISQIKQQANYANAADTTCPNGRVTVVFAVTNTNLNGTYCVLSSPTATTFSITVGGTATNSAYTFKTDPDLSVANGQVNSMSGYSDLGGQNSVISLGYGGWGPPYNPLADGNQWQKKAGTFMHELGHTMFLTHGGTFYNNLAGSNPPDYTQSFEANCKPNVQTVMSYLFQFDLLHERGASNKSGKPLMVVDYSNDSYATTINEASPGGPLSGLTYQNTASFQLPLVNSGAPHCDGSPLSPNDVEGGKSLTYVPFSDISAGFSWSGGQDLNFNGNATDVMHSHDEWTGTPAVPPLGLSPGVDLQQVSSLGTVSALGVAGEGGKYPPGGGGGKYPPGGGGGLFPPGGGGGKFPPGGGGGKYPPGGGGAKQDLTHEQANAYPRPAQDLTIVQEEASPRPIDLSWIGPTFGTPVQYNIYRSVAGGAFTPLASVPGTQTTYQDQVSCNAQGYRYEVTAVINNDSGQQLESVPSNIVPASGQALLTGCYTVSSFTVPASAVQGNTGVQITWTLTDDFYITPGTGWQNAASGNPVTRSAANTLVAIGPQPGNCTNSSYRSTLVADGTPTQAGTVDNGTVDKFTSSTNNFTFTWNRTDAFCAGHYTFELDLDHVNGSPAQTQTAATALQLGIDISDQDAPRITTLSLPDATADVAYNPPPLTEDGGVGAITWSSSGLPAGIMLNPATGVFSGFTTTAGTYNFTVTATDSKGNTGTQAFSLVVHIFVSATPPVGNPPFTANPALPDATVGVAYSQAVTEEGGTPAFTWTVTGSLPSGISQQPGNSPNLSGTTCVAGSYNLNASVIDSKLNTGMQALTLNVDKANTTTTVASSANPSVFQQMVTFTVTVTPQGSCGPATGTVTLSIDGVQFGTAQMLFNGSTSFGPLNTLSVNTHSISASYSGDGNFNSSNGALSPSQTVNHAQTQIMNVSASPSPAFVGQPITVSFNFSVMAPGAGVPTPPSGSITVVASDSSHCAVAASVALLGGGMCTLTPAPAAPTVPGTPITYTVTYVGDANFVGSGGGGNYPVYQLVFTTQPSNTGVGLTITPAVVVTAQDGSGNTLNGSGGTINFTGGITLAIGSGPGTLSGTPTQNAVAGVATFGDLSINKIANGYTLTASPAGGVPAATSTAFNVDTFYVDSQGNFGTLDLATGAVHQIGATTVPGSNGIDLTPALPIPGLQVYAYNASNQLMQITPSTGAATQVGSGTTGSIPDQATIGALTDGTYFGIDAVTGILYSINLTTGATTQVGSGPTGVAVLPTGCNLESSLAGSENTLYYTIGYSGPSCSVPMNDTLYQINPTSAVATLPGVQLSSNGFVGSAFVGGTLYGFTSGGQEFTINTATGVATLVANTTPTTAIFGAGSSQ